MLDSLLGSDFCFFLLLDAAGCWTAWREQINSTNLTANSDITARNYIVNTLNMTPPVDPSAVCSNSIFGFGTSPVPAVLFGLPAKSNNYTCFGQQMRSLTMVRSIDPLIRTREEGSRCRR